MNATENPLYKSIWAEMLSTKFRPEDKSISAIAENFMTDFSRKISTNTRHIIKGRFISLPYAFEWKNEYSYSEYLGKNVKGSGWVATNLETGDSFAVSLMRKGYNLDKEITEGILEL